MGASAATVSSPFWTQRLLPRLTGFLPVLAFQPTNTVSTVSLLSLLCRPELLRPLVFWQLLAGPIRALLPGVLMFFRL